MSPNNFGQQMQRQQQQQMQQMQQRQREMGWYKQQQDEKRRREEEERRAAEGVASLGRPGSNAPVFQLDVRFAEVEEQVKKLRQELASGKINEKKFQEKARELMVQDGQGSWWMVGSESGIWYRYDGVGWLQATPPGNYVGVSMKSGMSISSVAPRKRASIFVRIWHAFLSLVVIIPFTFALSLGLGAFVEDKYGSTEGVLVAGIVGLIGLWISINAIRNAWNE